ncbi:MAG: DNA-protecting protein DprA [Rhodocyclaceae bacterium]|nr:DNA-protecting protein DprA [Rhodocyclaceae bacterium]
MSTAAEGVGAGAGSARPLGVSTAAADSPHRHGAATSARQNLHGDRLDWLGVALRPRLSWARLQPALAAAGSPGELLRMPARQLEAIGGRALADAVAATPEGAWWARALEWLEDLAGAGHHLIAITDADYPALLRQTADPPPVLFVCGRRELLHGPALAVVGSRNPTPAGAENARAFSSALARAGITVVSGLARGIDGLSHEAALTEPGSTIAVLGVGPDVIYPKAHRGLQARIAAAGCLVSEMPPGMGMQRYAFPRRNRIIAGLSLGCLVVEAATASGSLITAREALEAGREVFAVPGSIHSPQSRGCHRLIRQGAVLVEMLADILEALPLGPLEASARGAAAAIHAEASAGVDQNGVEAVTGDATRKAQATRSPLLTALGDEPSSLDALVTRSGLDAPGVLAGLMELELDGHVGRTADGRFQRIRKAVV